MRIYFVYLGQLPTATTANGGSRRVRDLARGLASCGHEVHVLTPRCDSIGPGVEVVDGIRSRKPKFRTNALKNPVQRILFWRFVETTVTAELPDWLVLYNTGADSFPTLLSARAKGVRVALERCDLGSVASRRWWSPRRWITFANAYLSERLLPRAVDLNIVISTMLLDHCRKAAPQAVSCIVPILVDSDRFTSSIVTKQTTDSVINDRLNITYVGAFAFHEGVGILLNAFAILRQTIPFAQLTIAGGTTSGSDDDDVRAIIKELGILDSVTLLGWVDTETVIRLLNQADVLVVPQLNHKFCRAALPTKLAEYAAMGKLIVATDVGDVNRYFSDGRNAILCRPGDVNALAQALRRVVEDPSLAVSLGRAARSTALQVFDYRNAVLHLSKLMSSIHKPAD